MSQTIEPDTPTAAEPVCPECVQGKHWNCDGHAWDFGRDEPAVCACWARHQPPNGYTPPDQN